MPNSNAHWRRHTDTVAQYNVTSKLSLLGNFDWGGGDRCRDERAQHSGPAWQAMRAIPSMIVIRSPRVMTITTGTDQNINEFTGTFERIFAKHLITRLEFRRDFSNHPVFMRGNSFIDTQSTLTGGLIYVFDVHSAQ